MGLDIVSYPIMDGIAVINDVYGHVRDIRITKEVDIVNRVDSVYKVDCVFYIFKNINNFNKNIDSIYISKIYSDDFLTKTWEDVYTIVKEHLTSIGITYVDNV
jgi:hypothetical protein